LSILIGAPKEVLETKVKPAIVTFLKERGLELSDEKTRITHIDDGFDFLGFSVRKYAGKLQALQGGDQQLLGTNSRNHQSQRCDQNGRVDPAAQQQAERLD
jgi:hypothetical protein